MKMVFKKRAPSPFYLSPSLLIMDCFQTPFEQQLNPENRWVVLSRLMPWDEVCNLYLKNVGVSPAGRPPLKEPGKRGVWNQDPCFQYRWHIFFGRTELGCL